MSPTVRATEWKPEETAGTHSQSALSLIGAVPGPRAFDAELLGRVSFSGLLSWSAERAGMSDQQIADEMHISHGYMSKFMRGVAESWARRLVLFMRATGSVAPVECVVVRRNGTATQVREVATGVVFLARTAAILTQPQARTIPA